jgi:hypothetical protein
MSSPGRQSLVHLGALTVLTAGAIALSLATAPPVAEQQLHIGAGATTGVGSFVMDLVNTVTTRAPSPGGSARVQSRTLHIVYQAPDRLHETLSAGPGQTIDIVVIGNQRYQRTAAGRWVQLPPGRTGSVSTGQAAVNGVVLVPATAATAGTPVVRHGKTSSALYAYGLPPAQLATVYRVLFGVTGAVIAQHAFDATIDKEYMVSQTFLAAAGNQTDRIAVRYSELGTAPAVTPPPPSALR